MTLLRSSEVEAEVTVNMSIPRPLAAGFFINLLAGEQIDDQKRQRSQRQTCKEERPVVLVFTEKAEQAQRQRFVRLVADKDEREEKVVPPGDKVEDSDRRQRGPNERQHHLRVDTKLARAV